MYRIEWSEIYTCRKRGDQLQAELYSGSVVLGYKARGDILAKSGIEGAAAGAGAQETSFSPRIPDKVCSSVKVASPDVVAGVTARSTAHRPPH